VTHCPCENAAPNGELQHTQRTPHTATHCSTLCNTLQPNLWLTVCVRMQRPMAKFNTYNVHRTWQHTATHCATRCNQIRDSLFMQVPRTNPTICNIYNTLQHAAQHAATESVTRYLCRSHWRIQSPATNTAQCNTLHHIVQHAATLCNTLRNTLQPNPWLTIYAGPTGESNHAQRVQKRLLPRQPVARRCAYSKGSSFTNLPYKIIIMQTFEKCKRKCLQKRLLPRFPDASGCAFSIVSIFTYLSYKMTILQNFEEFTRKLVRVFLCVWCVILNTHHIRKHQPAPGKFGSWRI